MSSEPLFANNEQKDLEKLHQDQAKEYETFSSLVRHYLEMDTTMLGHCGHKTVEAALLFTSKEHVKKLNALVAAHIKKYPD